MNRQSSFVITSSLLIFLLLEFAMHVNSNKHGHRHVHVHGHGHQRKENAWDKMAVKMHNAANLGHGEELAELFESMDIRVKNMEKEDWIRIEHVLQGSPHAGEGKGLEDFVNVMQ
ncbi:uncharacterized protein LOC102809757, partial [Saccoglossus kowalevskii]|uniref:Uncharacterized protein LOC102809757 n=1 Tax=Saccoglossus kowalevskii TaxID=10224 RepID=A0ABM0M8H2_SACKO